MNRDTLRQILIVLAVAVTIVVNGLANALPINGQQTGEISDRFQVFFVPAGYVFAIWGVIYIGLIAFAVYQALPAQKTNPRLRPIGTPFIISCLANSIWIFLWHYNQFGWSVLAMLVLLAMLLLTYLRLGIGRQPASSQGMRWLVFLPISIYLGWITVATVANITDFLNWIGWNGTPFSPEAWAIIMLGIATAITALMLITRRDYGYTLVIVWAFAGIAIKFNGVSSVAPAAWAATVIVAALTVAARLRLLPKLERRIA